MKQVSKRTLSILVATIITLVFSFAKATTYLKCASKDIKTCTQELTKGESIVEKVKNPKTVIVKVDFVEFDLDKGTIKVDKD